LVSRNPAEGDAAERRSIAGLSCRAELNGEMALGNDTALDSRRALGSIDGTRRPAAGLPSPHSAMRGIGFEDLTPDLPQPRISIPRDAPASHSVSPDGFAV